ncbi:MAG TPA: PQQ-dependent sugar dehydrogenase [Pirellulales bacterium]|nr:PQQ-dependent sugar dehydrogenase [Pirellulales bacterium]
MRNAFLFAGLVVLSADFVAPATEPDASPASVPFDTHTRVPWKTSRVYGRPDPPLPYRLTRVFEKLVLAQPLFLTHEPTTGDLLVAQLQGPILIFPNRPDVDHAETFLDVGEDTYSFAFDPHYADNRYVYVFSNGPRDEKEKRNRIARYHVTAEQPLRCDPATRHVILDYESNGHNGGDLAFGPDEMLYISAGDGTSDSDTNLTGQNLADLPSGILRIDVRGSSANERYKAPADNPFVAMPGARGEIWAYGLRNPWRISFDRENGRLWVGDVGQDWREMIYLIQRGGNYGWSVEEGGQPFQPLRDRGPTAIVPPVVAHPHSEARSVTGGHVYYGRRFADLRGAYVYADFATGKFWGLRYDGQAVTWHQELADTSLQVVSFGADAAGELYVVDLAGGIYQFEVNDARESALPFPRRLSETGLFASTADHVPAPGVIPYSVNAPLWSDGAKKERFLAIPDDGQIQFTESRGWNLPDHSVVVKTFFLDTDEEAGDLRRVETRLMVRDQGEWTGYSYEWNDAQTDAELVVAAGLARDFEVRDTATGEPALVTWRFPSRAECMVCHTRAANYVLGLSALQMNRAHDYGTATENQLEVLERLGVFRDKLPKRPAEMGALADPANGDAAVDVRARSYLHANCSHCHVSAGGGNARLELEFTTPPEKMNLLAERPLHDRFGVADALLLAPGDPERSLLLTRIKRTERGRMPPLATSVVDRQAVALFESWIAEQKSEAASTK